MGEGEGGRKGKGEGEDEAEGKVAKEKGERKRWSKVERPDDVSNLDGPYMLCRVPDS
jgi:hypothetical protein